MTLFDVIESAGSEAYVTSAIVEDMELRAKFLGQERAGVPSWSRSAKMIAGSLAAMLASVDGDRREALASIEEDSYRQARIRKLQRIAALDKARELVEVEA